MAKRALQGKEGSGNQHLPSLFLFLEWTKDEKRDALLRNVISRLASEYTLQTCTLSKKLDSGSASSTSHVNLSLSPKRPHAIKD